MEWTRMEYYQGPDGLWYVKRYTLGGAPVTTPWGWKHLDSALRYIASHGLEPRPT